MPLWPPTRLFRTCRFSFATTPGPASSVSCTDPCDESMANDRVVKALSQFVQAKTFSASHRTTAALKI